MMEEQLLNQCQLEHIIYWDVLKYIINYVLWDKKVDLISGKNSITLDQNNTYDR